MHETQTVLNVTSKSRDWRAYTLSNFPCFPFALDGQLFASTEGFIQGIKYPEKDTLRQQCFTSWGMVAKSMGEHAERKFVWWNGKAIRYGTAKHHRLIARAIRAKFACNLGALMALQATRGLILIHDVGPESPYTSLPASVFCEILTEIRATM